VSRCNFRSWGRSKGSGKLVVCRDRDDLDMRTVGPRTMYKEKNQTNTSEGKQ
jgi:hypothetical protein